MNPPALRRVLFTMALALAALAFGCDRANDSASEPTSPAPGTERTADRPVTPVAETTTRTQPTMPTHKQPPLETLKPEPGPVEPLPPADSDSPPGPGEQLPNAERDHCALVLAEQVWSGEPSVEPVLAELRSASSPGCTQAIVDAIVGRDDELRSFAVDVLAERRDTLLLQVIGRLKRAEGEAEDRLIEALETVSGGAGHGNDASAWRAWAESETD